MRVGLVGFARAGKTTIFNALTGMSAGVGGFAEKRGAHMGVVKVPDKRLEALAEIIHPQRQVHAEITFFDFPPKGAEERKGVLEGQTVAQMREVDALAQVVRAFVDPLSLSPPQPVQDLRAFHSEMILADLAIVEKRLDRLKKEKGKEREQDLLERCRHILEEEKPLRSVHFQPEEETTLNGFAFLSQKPLLIVYNLDEADLQTVLPPEVVGYAEDEGLVLVPICGKVEMEIAQLEEEEQEGFLKDMGLEISARDRFIQSVYQLLSLISFFTAGRGELRAWPIPKGTSALKAAGKVHTDMERGFIRAEVITFDDYLQYRGEAGCREVGKMRLEGKEYGVRDGDVVHFRFKV